MQHPSQGTWLGVTKHGRVALLTNFSERDKGDKTFARSRGELAKLFLTADASESPAQFAERLVSREGIQDMDGFSLIFGFMQEDDDAGTRQPLGIISNRTPEAKDTIWVAGDHKHTWGQTCALSNSRYADRAWPKVVEAEKLLEETVQRHAESNSTQQDLVKACFQVLSRDTLPPRNQTAESWANYAHQLRNTIFVPRIVADPDKAHLSPEAAGKAGSMIYGTQMQTIILVDRQRNVTFVERTLYDEHAVPLPVDKQDRRFEFTIGP